LRTYRKSKAKIQRPLLNLIVIGTQRKEIRELEKSYLDLAGLGMYHSKLKRNVNVGIISCK
jgi:hypothetical protein